MEIWSATVDAFTLLASGDAALWLIVWVSLKVAIAGLLLAAPPGLLIAYLIAMHRFMGRRALVVLAQASLSFPTVLIGLLLYLLLSRQGPLGGFGLLFTQGGMILGQAVLGLPVIVAFALATLERADPRLAETARVLGAGRVRLLLTVFRELRFGLMAAVVAGFGGAARPDLPELAFLCNEWRRWIRQCFVTWQQPFAPARATGRIRATRAG